jgi:acetyl esterase/lipase
MYAFVGDAFADKGYITVIADYRKYPAVGFPTFVADGAKAVAWTYDHIERYGGDLENLYIAGHSSGAHIGALITADERYLQSEGKSPTMVNAFVGLAGPYDFVPKADDLKDIFGPPAQYPQMQVTTFIDGSEPPMLLLWGEDDETVLRRNIDLLAEKISSQRGQVETKIYKGVDHVAIVASLTWYLKNNRSVLTDVVTFFDKYKKGN